MDAVEMRRLAWFGARARLVEIEEERSRLDTERARLIAMFPELGKKPRGPIAKAKPEPAVIFDAEEHGRRPRRKHTDEFKARIVALLKAGSYVRDVAEEYDLPDTAVRRWAKAARVKVREVPMDERVKRQRASKQSSESANGKASRGGGNRPMSKETALKRDELLRRVAEGETVQSVAKYLNVNRNTAHGWTKGRGAAAAAMALNRED